MSETIKIISNVDGILCLKPSANPIDVINIPKKGAAHPFTKEQARYIFLTQQVIQKGMALVEDKELKVEFGLETEKGENQNPNILSDDNVKELIQGNYKKLEKALGEVTENHMLKKFVDVARELKIDSKAKIDIIEKFAKLPVYVEE